MRRPASQLRAAARVLTRPLTLTLALGLTGASAAAQRPDALALPAPGSYALPVIQPAGNGWVLEGSQLPRRLSAYTEGAITLLSFIYTYCSDPQGCPLAYATMQGVKQRIAQDPALAGRVRFVSLSFDPTHDTPEAMRRYGSAEAASQSPRWHFLTTYSTRFLLPILSAYGQDIELERDAGGTPTRAISHLLKAFLIDAQGQVREIYSTAYMNPQLVFNDIKTLALGAAPTALKPAPRPAPNPAARPVTPVTGLLQAH